MANEIKRIELIDVRTWDGTDWVILKQSKAGTITDIDSIMVYDDATGVTVTEKQITLNWASFSSKTASGLTIFGDSGGLIASTKTSIRIRYKLKTTTAGSPDNEVVSSYFYQLIKFAVPSSGGISGLPTGTTNSIDAQIVVNVPAFTNDMVANAVSFQSYLATTTRWRLKWTNPAGVATEYQPSQASVGSPTADSTSEYNGYKVPVTLSYRLPCISTGTYSLQIYFYPNDGDTRTLFTQSLSCTATVTVNLATQSATIIYATDSSVAIDLTFSS